jgi:hypothetical protein
LEAVSGGVRVNTRFPLFGRQNSIVHQFLTESNEEVSVHVEYGDCDATDRSTTDEEGPAPPEVARPTVAAGVEKGGQLLRDPVPASDIRAFMRIAMETR